MNELEQFQLGLEQVPTRNDDDVHDFGYCAEHHLGDHQVMAVDRPQVAVDDEADHFLVSDDDNEQVLLGIPGKEEDGHYQQPWAQPVIVPALNQVDLPELPPLSPLNQAEEHHLPFDGNQLVAQENVNQGPQQPVADEEPLLPGFEDEYGYWHPAE